MNTDFITIKDIASEVYDHPLMADIPFERIVRKTQSFIKIVRMPTVFEDKEADIEISKWRGLLPCDYYQMHQVVTRQPNGRCTAFRASTDTFSPVGTPAGMDYTYKISNRIIYTTLPEGVITISYQAIKVDEDGFPMIINNESFIRALVSYIKYDHFTTLFDSGKINQNVMEKAEKDYYANVAQAQNSLIPIDNDHMESIARIINDAFTRQREHANMFKDISKQHTIRTS